MFIRVGRLYLPEEHIDSMQNSLRILSGLYGLLKPLDLIQPYRLEMGTSLKINSSNNLYEFWGSFYYRLFKPGNGKGRDIG